MNPDGQPRVTTAYTSPKTLLNKGSGFLSSYSHSLNPYAGCAFACSYCYVRQLPVALFRKQEWGSWVDVKHRSVSARRISGADHPFFAGSDGKRSARLSAGANPQSPGHPRYRPAEQLKDRVRVSLTVETDREEIRRAFTPYAPPIAARLRAGRLLAEAGTQACRFRQRSLRCFPAASGSRTSCFPGRIACAPTTILWATAAGEPAPPNWAYARDMNSLGSNPGIRRKPTGWFMNACCGCFPRTGCFSVRMDLPRERE